ncbi:MAG TPA: tRNA (adenosine(37)-N6)-threonylcarbamoyltransferase complex ATPase subunit type 1 TsaE [Burkholderiales bacterium]|nr:tRNA (adenosine(37)-N6)-threonylcarbamoyltransferase complex ATPase subunit type 1 TsaE [Burkholderiales bacterium]
MMRDLKLPDPAATEALGVALAPGVAPGRVLHLRGDLGTGKTTVVRGLLRGLGYEGKVRSPTYPLVEPYSLSSLHLYHFDFFRLKDSAEWESSGFREYFGPHAACLVEWPERVGTALGTPDLELRLEFAENGRRARVSSHTPAGEAWLSSLRLPA